MQHFGSRNSGKTKALNERYIEAALRFYNTYLVGIKNCEQQLEYIMPSLVARYSTDSGESFFIVNNTEKVALDRIESKRALDLKEEIERYKIITSSIDNALANLTEIERRFVILRYFECKPMAVVTEALGYTEEKSCYRIRRHILDKLLISLGNLLSLK
jgi:DNA-directed RNA polymerase specialized sigma subunit